MDNVMKKALLNDYRKDIVKDIRLAGRTDGLDSIGFSLQAIAECLYLMLEEGVKLDDGKGTD